MPLVSIENTSDQYITVCLNSGQTWHLRPHEIREGIEQVETKGNESIKRLVGLRLITVQETETKAKTGKKPTESKKATDSTKPSTVSAKRRKRTASKKK